MIEKRSVTVNGRRTAVAVEAPFWAGVRVLAASRRIRISELIGEIDVQRGDNNLSSAIRLAVLAHYRAASTRGADA